MILQPTPICSSKFSFINKTFIAECSDFGPRGIQFGRVYDDACDYGFTIVSKETGHFAEFAFNGYEHDAEGEIQALIFTCVTPGLKYLRAKIFND